MYQFSAKSDDFDISVGRVSNRLPRAPVNALTDCSKSEHFEIRRNLEFLVCKVRVPVPVRVLEVPVRVLEVPVRVLEVPVRVLEVPVRVLEVHEERFEISSKVDSFQ